MQQSTEKWLARLEAQKRAILAEVRDWPEELRTARPKNGEWIALEVLDHLVRTEAGICGVVMEMLAEPQPIGVKDRIGVAFVEQLFRSRRRVKVPKSVEDIILPGDGLELEEIAQRWDRARMELARVADCVEKARCRGGVFRHPVGGWMSFEQVLRFFSVHVVHHEYQLERIRATAESSTSQSR